MKTWEYKEIRSIELKATDLAAEARDNAGGKAYRIDIEGSPESAEALYYKDEGRLGIAWGADGNWADVEDLISGIEMWLNDPEEWEACN